MTFTRKVWVRRWLPGRLPAGTENPGPDHINPTTTISMKLQPKPIATQSGRAPSAALLSLLFVLVVAGCRSLSEPGSASFASVTIQNHTPQEIMGAAAEVFRADGYRVGMSNSGQMVCEKEASRATTMSREGLVATQSGAQTINRVRAEIVPLGPGSHRLQCKAYMVTGGSDTFFQDEVPLTNLRSLPYQSLLNKVEQKLKETAGTATPAPKPQN
jgi:hypothetical protein